MSLMQIFETFIHVYEVEIFCKEILESLNILLSAKSCGYQNWYDIYFTIYQRRWLMLSSRYWWLQLLCTRSNYVFISRFIIFLHSGPYVLQKAYSFLWTKPLSFLMGRISWGGKCQCQRGHFTGTSCIVGKHSINSSFILSLFILWISFFIDSDWNLGTQNKNQVHSSHTPCRSSSPTLS